MPLLREEFKGLTVEQKCHQLLNDNLRLQSELNIMTQRIYKLERQMRPFADKNIPDMIRSQQIEIAHLLARVFPRFKPQNFDDEINKHLSITNQTALPDDGYIGTRNREIKLR